MYLEFYHLKVQKKAVPFKSKVCFGREGLWKLLEGFQETCGRAIQVGVIGEFYNILCLTTYMSRCF
jgi:hypothetical protein